MKLAFLLSALLAIANSVEAQNRIDLFADQAMTQCSLIDNTPALQTVHVFLSGPAPATGVFFSAPRPACWQGATWVGDGFPGYRGSSGNSQIGLFTTLYVPGFLECKTPPVMACSIFFVASGAGQACCELVVVGVPSPMEPYPLMYFDCLTSEQPASAGRKVVINPNDSCQCAGPVTAEPTTWGRVKSLYR